LISSQGGHNPAWRQDGRELFYVAADMTLMAVALDTHRGMVRPAAPSPLFQLQTDPLSATFAATSDGQRFLVNQVVQAPSPQVTVVLNWTSK
jgi:eukaryotic-like serine/threonine-protein kinase